MNLLNKYHPVHLHQNIHWLPNNIPRHVERNHDYSLLHKKDRKSTRLNSSHVRISYAVFCLKKKNNITVDLAFFFLPFSSPPSLPPLSALPPEVSHAIRSLTFSGILFFSPLFLTSQW